MSRGGPVQALGDNRGHHHDERADASGRPGNVISSPGTMPLMSAPRSILHLDMDAFFATVEQRDHPELRGRPLLIGHDGPRGVVATASYEARPFGCHSAQPMVVAKRLCPQAIVVEVRHDRYRKISQHMFAILDEFSP